MIERAFQHRSGRVIALARLILAGGSLAAIIVDPTQPSSYHDLGYSVLIAYCLWSGAVLALTWGNWWRDFQLAPVAHALDILVFGLLVALTEGYTSPFFVFFTFIVLSAAIRWGWLETAATAAIVVIMFYAVGFYALSELGEGADLRAFLVRGAYLLVLSLILTWFGVNRQGRGGAEPSSLDVVSGSGTIPIVSAMEYAAGATRSNRLIFVWSDREEPWTYVDMLEGGAHDRLRYGPNDLPPAIPGEAGDGPFLFEQPLHRILVLDPRGRKVAREAGLPPAFAERFSVESGLVIRIRSGDVEGDIFALDVPGMCADDLEVAQALGHDISAAFDRSRSIATSEETAIVNTRLALARDLHDSVLQVFAGAAFQLQALKERVGQAAQDDIQRLHESLAAEQRHLRHYITELGTGRGSARPVDLGKGLEDLSHKISRQWGVRCAAFANVNGVEVSARAEHELHQLLREAAANAVRHGHANSINIELATSSMQLSISVADNGRGFPVHGEFGEEQLRNMKICPLTLQERVRHLGGLMSIMSSPVGSRLSVTIPLEQIA